MDTGSRLQDQVLEEGTEAQLQMITFNLGKEMYGVDIMAVREIRVWSDTTPLPNSPEFVIGVIDLRGVIVPVFDLLDRFGHGETTPTKSHAVIIVVVGENLIGLVVNAVSDIVYLKKSDIRAVPEMQFKQNNEFLTGLASVNEQMVALISIDKLFNKEILDAVTDDQQTIEEDV